MSEKNTAKLREDYKNYGKQLKENLQLIDEKENYINTKKLENKNYKDKVQFLQEDLITKRAEYLVKLENIQKRTKEESEVKKIVDKTKKEEPDKDKIDKIKLNKLVDVYKSTKSHAIVEAIINDYSLLSSELDKIYSEKERTAESDEISFVYLKYEEQSVPFRITDEYYTVSDLLKEACRYFECSHIIYRIHNHELKTLNMTLGVRTLLQNLREKLGNIPNLLLLPSRNTGEIKKDLIQNEEKEIKIIKKDEEEVGFNTAELLKDIEEVENELLDKIKKIIFYIVFLCFIFLYNLSISKIQQTFYIQDAFNTRIAEKKYFITNQFGLENSFKTIRSLSDIMSWGFFSLMEIFEYPTVSNNTNSNIFTRVMSDFVIIGSIRFMYTRLDNNPLLNFTYTKIKGYEKYNNFKTISNLNQTIYFNGDINDYYISQAYTVNIPPKDREVHLVFSMFRNLGIFTSNLKTFSVEFGAYNYNNDVFVRNIFLIEQNVNGYISTKSQICVLNYLHVIYDILNFTFCMSAITNVCFFILIFLYSLYNIIDIILEIKKLKNKLDYLNRIWNVLKIIQITLYVLCLSFRIYLYYHTQLSLKFVASNEFVETSHLCDLYDTLKILEILMICSTMIYFLNYLDENIVGPVIDTLLKSRKNIIVFIVCYCFTITGYGISFNYIFGCNSLEIKTFPRSIIRLFLMVFGDFSIVPEMSKLFHNLTMIFLFGFGLTFFLLFSNWLTATIIQWYDVNNKEKSQTKTSSGTVRVSILQELEIVKNKFIRSLWLRINSIIEIIKKVKEIKNIIKIKKNVKAKESLKNKDNINNISDEESRNDREDSEAKENEDNNEEEDDRQKSDV